jgi:hypothetical protein
MKIETIKYEEKFSKTQFEPVLIGFTAILTESDNAVDALSNLKQLAHNFFYTQVMGRQPEPKVEAPKEEVKVVEEVKEEKPKKAKKEKVEKSKSEKMADVVEGVEVPPVIPAAEVEEMETVESPYKASKNTVIYDLKNKDHRDRLAAYLNKTYPAWKSKPKEQLLAMSQELSGKPFEDSNGSMLDSFKNILSSYFE